MLIHNVNRFSTFNTTVQMERITTETNSFRFLLYK